MTTTIKQFDFQTLGSLNHVQDVFNNQILISNLGFPMLKSKDNTHCANPRITPITSVQPTNTRVILCPTWSNVRTTCTNPKIICKSENEAEISKFKYCHWPVHSSILICDHSWLSSSNVSSWFGNLFRCSSTCSLCRNPCHLTLVW
jgi:hypothetical protein